MLVVNCSQCGEKHHPGEVKTINIEEDIMGYDVLTYICPKTKKQTKAYVLGEPDFDPNCNLFSDSE